MASNPYTSQAIAGYNSSPPPDGGERTAANALTWEKHETTLSGPVKTLAEEINTENVGAFGQLIMTTDPGEETVVIAMQEFGGR